MDDLRIWLVDRFPDLVLLTILAVGVALLGREERRY